MKGGREKKDGGQEERQRDGWKEHTGRSRYRLIMDVECLQKIQIPRQVLVTVIALFCCGNILGYHLSENLILEYYSGAKTFFIEILLFSR